MDDYAAYVWGSLLMSKGKSWYLFYVLCDRCLSVVYSFTSLFDISVDPLVLSLYLSWQTRLHFSEDSCVVESPSFQNTFCLCTPSLQNTQQTCQQSLVSSCRGSGRRSIKFKTKKRERGDEILENPSKVSKKWTSSMTEVKPLGTRRQKQRKRKEIRINFPFVQPTHPKSQTYAH